MKFFFFASLWTHRFKHTWRLVLCTYRAGARLRLWLLEPLETAPGPHTISRGPRSQVEEHATVSRTSSLDLPRTTVPRTLSFRWEMFRNPDMGPRGFHCCRTCHSISAWPVGRAQATRLTQRDDTPCAQSDASKTALFSLTSLWSCFLRTHHPLPPAPSFWDESSHEFLWQTTMKTSHVLC